MSLHANRNLRLMNGFTLCVNMSFILGVIIPYYRDEMGLGFREFLIGEAAFAAVVVLLEVPSGWLSDVWRRKHVLALGALFDMIGYACLIVGDSLAWAIAAQSLIGVGISLMSGTNTAMVYDSLLAEGREGEFRAREGKRAGLGFYSVAGASAVSGLLYSADHFLPLLLSQFVLLAAIIMACRMTEPPRLRKPVEKHPLADMAATAHYALRGHADIGLIIVFSSVMFCATKMIMWTQQPYYAAIGLHESVFGLLMAAGFMLAGLSSHLGHRLDGRGGNLRILAAAWAVAIAVCLGASAHLGLSGVALLMVGGSCLYGIAGPRVSEAINNRVDSARRATILSTQSLMVNLAFIPVSFYLGWLSDLFGVRGALLGIALWLGLAGLALAALLLKKERRQRMLML